MYGKFLERERPLKFLILNEAQRLGVTNQILIQMLYQYVKISINHQTHGLPNQCDKVSWFARVSYNFRRKMLTFKKNHHHGQARVFSLTLLAKCPSLYYIIYDQLRMRQVLGAGMSI